MVQTAKLLCLLLASAPLAPGTAIGMDRLADWQVGDLIFQESSSPQASAIRVATNSHYTHMGIVREGADGLYVIEAARTVMETPLGEFIARGVGQDYSVYRVKGLTDDMAQAAIAEMQIYYGRPYDIFFRIDPDEIYCSELPFHAFSAIGIEIGRVERLGDLAIDTPEGRAIFLARWQDHPDCRAEGLDRDGCWNLLQDQKIVTPIGIAEASNVERVFTSFDGAP
ncbi:hypothetical protein CES85_5203 [Ochrobactrum quorumnocens]|uniref:Permuted papain-like amidase YaeF/Yiix C92 family enzyme n=1 Tax=Ochrobactrum quorumnocens TaxID=271865 RepID=A0A248UDL4_9HYPH|nr:YiiX/YebB-like N1pC/P60 family cysteine hydrolase [[Ochrobactrum] quorumnocens]ASV84409.1 hypothetical protein CES85_5203 [[Ochrobactrum] quorumnocens]